MKSREITLKNALIIAGAVVAFSIGNVPAQVLHVDSVSVDSVWNSDSSWTDGGVAQQRQSRDCNISFAPKGVGAALMSLTMSTDSGKTFAAPQDTLHVQGFLLYSPLPTGQRQHITVRVLGGNRPGVSFRITARQEAPVVAGNPSTCVLGPLGALTAGADAQAHLGILSTGDLTSYGYSTIAKVYWDALADGTIDDSTSGATAQSWTWQTKVPAGAAAQIRKVIALAVDHNGIKAEPETLSVQFGLHRQIVMKNIPAGTFQMGETGVVDTVHQVTLAAFAMQETPVTQEQFAAVMGATPSYSVGDLTRPVEKVSWYDAVLYCNGLSKLSGLDTCYTYTAAGATNAVCDYTKKGYRLPSEAEFEFACRGGTTTAYWWGNDSNGLGARVYTPPYGAASTTIPAGSLLPNAYGLYDIQGNGWKWCNDWFAQPYASTAQTNPKGPQTGVARVLRGGVFIGSFFVLQNFYRSAYRDDLTPAVFNEYTGFTCAMTK